MKFKEDNIKKANKNIRLMGNIIRQRYKSFNKNEQELFMDKE
jgi:hypothetical protein